MQSLKITITDSWHDDSNYHAKNKTTPDVIGELNFDATCYLDGSATVNLCDAILLLFPHNPVKLDISYSIDNS
jgi:hypothetical protein